MKPMNKLFVAGLLSLTVSPLAFSSELQAADGVVAVSQSQGERLVRIHKITGTDEFGREHVLLSDKAGVVTNINGLANVDAYLNAMRIEQKGRFQNIKVMLADDTYFIRGNGYASRASLAESGTSAVVKVKGTVFVTKTEVLGSDLDIDVAQLNLPLAG